MAACPEYEPLLIEKCGGFLSCENEDRLSRHLATCARCRAEDALFREAVELAAPALDVDAEGRCSIAGATLGAWNRHDHRRTRARAFLAGVAVAAGLALAVGGYAWRGATRAEPAAAALDADELSPADVLPADDELAVYERAALSDDLDDVSLSHPDPNG